MDIQKEIQTNSDTNIRIDRNTHKRLKQIAKVYNWTLKHAVHEAVEQFN